MCKLRLINENMNELSFCILSRAVRRFLTERRCILSEEEGYAIKVCVNADLKDDRYVINSYNTHAEIKAANDCTVHAAVSRFFWKASLVVWATFLHSSVKLILLPVVLFEECILQLILKTFNTRHL